MDSVDKRLHFFDRQFLRARDFQAEQAYHLDRRRRHNTGFHSHGVVEGLLVVPSAEAKHVTIKPGWAVDPLGREIVLVASRTVPTGGVNVNIWVAYPDPEPLSDPSADPGVTGNTRVHEEPVPRVVPPDSILAHGILLASVSAGDVINNCVRPLAGLTDGTVTEATLKDRAVTEPKLADNAVSTRALADNAVTGPKIADDTIQPRNLHPDLRRMIGSRGVNVRMFGAKGDGVTDDREAIQQAIDAAIAARGGVVFFPAGDYVVDKIPPRETSSASFFINRVPVPLVFEGEGAASIIRMAPGLISPGEHWAMFHVVAPENVSFSQNVSFHHLLLHGNRRKFTHLPERRQIHCILLEQAVDVTVQNVEFREAVDDGINIQEMGGAASRRLTIVGNLFVDCKSSIILRGSPTAPIEDVVIQGNIVRHTSPGDVPKVNAVSLVNTQRVQFVSNTILGGVFWGRNIQDFVISNNIIVQGSEQDGAGLNLEGKAWNGAVTGNIIRAELTSTSRGIRFLFDERSPEKIRLSQNTILAGQTGININGRDISVSDNVIQSYLDEVGSPGEFGINVQREDGALGDAIQVRNNHIRNFHCAIKANGDNGLDLTRLVVVGNQIRGATRGPRTDEAIRIGPAVPAATVHGNQVAPGETIRLLTLLSGYIVTAVGFAGNGPPEDVAAEVGSLYTRLDGIPILWVKETGTGVEGWKPK